jgi:hypothetical protein
MTDAVHPVTVSDSVISALAERRPIHADDPLLRALEAWVERIDAVPLAPWTGPVPVCVKTSSRAEMARRVVALTVALTLSSSGIATAVSGDPLTPLHVVIRGFHHLRQPETPRAPRWPDELGRTASGRGVAPELSRSLTRRDPPPRHPAASTATGESPSP